VLRSIAELVAYGTFAVLLAVASFAPADEMASSATTSKTTTSDATAPAPDSTVVADRGAVLFAVKGCIGCHMHSAFPSARMQVGPDLSALAARAGSRVAGLDASAYVRQSLREPGAYGAFGGYVAMPDLRLSDDEIESLTAFLLSPSR
jgi:cytochrome c551/c552